VATLAALACALVLQSPIAQARGPGGGAGGAMRPHESGSSATPRLPYGTGYEARHPPRETDRQTPPSPPTPA